ncbi:MAG TPA: TetR/AcrR family transcriptional regulator [Capillimicrobium sp.]|nr:TetR/AcrR family transcriptional regulator [Capillimicrobium sp.]
MSTEPTTPRAPRRRRLTADERRELIERAATELFAERGYQGAGMSEIARRAGVSVPVVYDHFASKEDLYRRLLERHYADLRAVWGRHLAADESTEARMAHAIDAWFAYVQSHPFAWRMLFRDTTGDPKVEAIRREVADASRAQLLPLMDAEPAVTAADGSAAGVEMVWEVFRGSIQALALWWYEHQEVPREQVVATAMNALWVGYERVARGETWSPREA